MYPNFSIISHPLIDDKLSILRDKSTPNMHFRKLLSEISYLLTYEITRDLVTHEIEIETPLEKTKAKKLNDHIALVPILRAGLGMLYGILDLIPSAKVGIIGIYRDDKTLEAHEYYCKLPPDTNNRIVFLLDPMLASGHSIDHAINIIKKRNPREIRVVSIVAAPEGVEFVCKKHPDVKFYCTALDRTLNNHGYILPGLGDCGDRLLGTE